MTPHSDSAEASKADPWPAADHPQPGDAAGDLFPPGASPTIPVERAKVMIVDDEPIAVKVIRMHLRNAGYRNFITCTKPTNALRTIRRKKPDLVLLDIIMPGVGGLEVLRQIRADRQLAQLPVIILTAADDQQTMVKALELGATDFLGKPLDPVKLLPRARNALAAKACHDHLQNYARELERRVRQRTRQLEDHAAALEKANQVLERLAVAAQAATRAKSLFLANVSHEIRTPMTAILGFTEILLGCLDSAECIDAAMTIQRNGVHLLAIVNKLLDLSKIESGELEVERIPCPFAQIVDEVVSTLRPNAEPKNLALRVEYAGPVPESIRTDPTHVREILINLLGNAVKFTQRGTVRVVTRLARDADGDPRLHCDVIDTGIGMTETQMAKIFRPFNQADSSVTRKFGGTGLGLAISRRLARALGGEITVSSTAGKGSTFSLTLPTGPLDDVAMLDRPAEKATPDHPPAPPTATATRLDCRILLAEDGIDNQRLIRWILEKAGAEVVVAGNGREAIQAALAATDGPADAPPQTHRPFDVLLMDMQMPVLDGYTATRELRWKGYDGPIIALTAHAMSADRQKCIDAGCDDYLSKPIHQAELLAMVSKHLLRCRAWHLGSPITPSVSTPGLGKSSRH